LARLPRSISDGHSKFLKELEEPQADTAPSASRQDPVPPRTRSSPAVADRGNGEGSNERQPLLRRHSHDEFDADIGGDAMAEPVPIAGGTVLGIHNLAIVFPQLIVILSPFIPWYLVALTVWLSTGCSGSERHLPRRGCRDRVRSQPPQHLPREERRGMGSSLRWILHAGKLYSFSPGLCPFGLSLTSPRIADRCSHHTRGTSNSHRETDEANAHGVEGYQRERRGTLERWNAASGRRSYPF
jgi:hypothetical protein